MTERGIIPIVLAGGSGKRFWPLSREARPKQFLRLFGGRSLLEDTVARLTGLAISPPVIVSAVRQADLVRECMGTRPHVLVTEPCGRNTGPAIALALGHVRHLVAASRARDGGDLDPVVSVFASDHHIPESAEFQRHLRAAAAFARDTRRIVTLGLVPTHPETGYGYIQTSPEVLEQAEGLPFHDVVTFVEKPDLETARRYMADGNHLWNSGMFLARVSVLAAEIGRHMADVAEGIGRIAETIGLPEYDETLAHVFPTLPSVSIDHGVLERSHAIGVLPARFAWSDVGSWNALPAFGDEQGTFVRGERVVQQGCRRVVVVREGQQAGVLALCGVEDVGVIQTDDALLVVHLDHAQDVRKILEILEKEDGLSSHL